MVKKAAPKILVVDDDQSCREALAAALDVKGYRVELARDGVDALELHDSSPADLVVAELDMPRLGAMDILAALRQRGAGVPVIVVSSTPDLRAAVSAMRGGAADYLTKPLDQDELLLALRRELVRQQAASENDPDRRQQSQAGSEGPGGLIGASEAMQELYAVMHKVAPSNATVLITGESGTGKSQVARGIHTLSGRANGPFITVHCACLSPSILESELFGHERGSFTGADKRRIGRFEQANGGTLFLDELGEISLEVQVKLLNVLQDRVLHRVGGNVGVPIDVRVVAATNRDISREVADGRFREDLYYRLNVVRLHVPPLRQRRGDVLQLAEAFLARFVHENDKYIRGFSPGARSQLENHDWPGNVRELENAIERAVVVCDGDEIEAAHLPNVATTSESDDLTDIHIPGASMADLERYAIVKTLAAVDGSTARAAEILEMSVRTIQYRLHEYGLAKTRGRPSSEPPSSQLMRRVK